MYQLNIIACHQTLYMGAVGFAVTGKQEYYMYNKGAHFNLIQHRRALLLVEIWPNHVFSVDVCDAWHCVYHLWSEYHVFSHVLCVYVLGMYHVLCVCITCFLCVSCVFTACIMCLLCVCVSQSVSCVYHVFSVCITCFLCVSRVLRDVLYVLPHVAHTVANFLTPVHLTENRTDPSLVTPSNRPW